MPTLSHSIIYIFLFIALYFEVFMLMTYVEHRKDIHGENNRPVPNPRVYPSVTIIIPVWNEAKTLKRTVMSILGLDYPKEKLEVMIVDDGSTDNTWEVMQQCVAEFSEGNRIRIFHKENGGKFTALNFALSKTTSDMVGCLDADSYVDRDALKHIIATFETDKTIMAVTPSIKIWEPKNIIELIQSVEYSWAIFLRKMLASIGAVYITPGPFSIFKREVFETVGPYREGHKTEDMELAMRMQTHGLKIANAYTAIVHTSATKTLKKLYVQRTRWTYGFIKNAIDYRFMFFKKKYGNLGVFILPVAFLSIFITLYATGTIIASFGKGIVNETIKVQTIGFHLPSFSFTFDWFSINTELIAVVSLLSFIGTILILFISRKMAENKIGFGMDMVYFLALYSFIVPLWLAKAVYNVLFSVTTNWR